MENFKNNVNVLRDKVGNILLMNQGLEDVKEHSKNKFRL